MATPDAQAKPRLRSTLVLGGTFLVITSPLGAESRDLARIREIVSTISQERLEAGVRRLVSFHNRNSFGRTDDLERGIGAATRWIEGELAAQPRLEVARDEFEFGVRKIANVVAVLPGVSESARSRLVVVCAHYDSRNVDSTDVAGAAPGANDDGSGTAAVLELAWVLSAHEFESSILFLAVSGEEQGLLGSRHFASAAGEGGYPIVGVLSNDCVGNVEDPSGRRDDRRLRVFSAAADGLDSPSRELARYVKSIAESYVDDLEVELVYRLDRLGRGGDHIPFHEAGWPAVRLTEMVENYERQHSQEDLPAGIDYPYLARVTRANAAVVASLAMAPEAPASASVSGAVRHEVEIRWEPVVDPDLDRYEVLVRRTSSPVWERVVPAARSENSLVLADERIDHAFFAVRAVDRDGYPSLARFAVTRP